MAMQITRTNEGHSYIPSFKQIGETDPHDREEPSVYSSLSLAQQPESIRAPQSLSKVLHQGISQLHETARRNAFLNGLILGEMTFCSKAYTLYLCNLFVIHESIEKAQKKIIEEYGEWLFVFPVLFRSERLLNDIKTWSIFNTLSSQFADKDIHSAEFNKNLLALVETKSVEFAQHMEKMTASKKDLLLAIGSIYALYGTILSGGQFVRKGVKSGFICRMEEADDEEEKVPLKAQIKKEIAEDKNAMEFFAEKSVSFFHFENKDFSILAFKQVWHKNLDDLVGKLGLEGKEREQFEKGVVSGANEAIFTVLNFIETMQLNLKKGLY
jgi:heme oxygenase